MFGLRFICSFPVMEVDPDATDSDTENNLYKERYHHLLKEKHKILEWQSLQTQLEAKDKRIDALENLIADLAQSQSIAITALQNRMNEMDPSNKILEIKDDMIDLKRSHNSMTVYMDQMKMDHVMRLNEFDAQITEKFKAIDSVLQTQENHVNEIDIAQTNKIIDIKDNMIDLKDFQKAIRMDIDQLKSRDINQALRFENIEAQLEKMTDQVYANGKRQRQVIGPMVETRSLKRLRKASDV